MTNLKLKLVDYSDPEDHFEDTLGIAPSMFRDAIQNGLQYYRGVNKFHPVTAGGSRAWEEIVATLRLRIIENYEGWKAEQRHGMPVLINAKLGKTIVVTSGDENTGVKEETPKTKNAKGGVTEYFVGQNLSLFDEAESDIGNITPVDSHETWVFLYTFDKNKSEIRFELSLPTGASISGNHGKVKITDWKNRVIFPAISFNEMPDEFKAQFAEDSDFFEVQKK
ncbi:hypothetical protein [Vibrio quintilis]|uniref:Uncharacterized protein n=1 Tax=Vibrio quintilis TaxID=1117707 RepID=A0A1M7YP77_9VIBR|nr:hypothetical protein [Vibrio quintilis]SHO54434.1 hypothetical protein VQ7734_00148 [Vibrio quintilis]